MSNQNNEYIHGIRPAVLDTTGQRYYGFNHCDAIASIPPNRELDVTQGDFGHCFECQLDHSIIGREEAAKLTGLPCNIQKGKLHSEDLHWQGPPGLANRPEMFVRCEGGFTENGIKVTCDFVARDEWTRARKRENLPV